MFSSRLIDIKITRVRRIPSKSFPPPLFKFFFFLKQTEIRKFKVKTELQNLPHDVKFRKKQNKQQQEKKHEKKTCLQSDFTRLNNVRFRRIPGTFFSPASAVHTLCSYKSFVSRMAPKRQLPVNCVTHSVVDKLTIPIKSKLQPKVEEATVCTCRYEPFYLRSFLQSLI